MFGLPGIDAGSGGLSSSPTATSGDIGASETEINTTLSFGKSGFASLSQGAQIAVLVIGGLLLLKMLKK